MSMVSEKCMEEMEETYAEVNTLLNNYSSDADGGTQWARVFL
jgi:hypothetical protein